MAKKIILPEKTPAEIVEASAHMGAHFSVDGRHRLALWRRWKASRPMVTFVGLNPSTANHMTNDPTITRVTQFVYAWNYGGVFMANLYSLISPNPNALLGGDALCTSLETWARYMVESSEIVVFAWGSWPGLSDIAQRREYYLELCQQVGRPVYCLGTNKDGQPKHPLYLKKTTKLIKL